jgi:hypothetical protein
LSNYIGEKLVKYCKTNWFSIYIDTSKKNCMFINAVVAVRFSKINNEAIYECLIDIRSMQNSKIHLFSIQITGITSMYPCTFNMNFTLKELVAQYF